MNHTGAIRSGGPESPSLTWRTAMKTLLLATAAVLGLSAGTSFGQALNSYAGGPPSGGLAYGAPAAGQTVLTPRGPVFTTGHVGGVQTTTLPGGAGQGLLINNGNGTSTLTGPGGLVTTVPTPR
jgi:hypothetical protein